jgi:hypothetical protein
MINAQGSDYVLCVYTITHSPQTQQRFLLTTLFMRRVAAGSSPRGQESARAEARALARARFFMRGSSPRVSRAEYEGQ